MNVTLVVKTIVILTVWKVLKQNKSVLIKSKLLKIIGIGLYAWGETFAQESL